MGTATNSMIPEIDTNTGPCIFYLILPLYDQACYNSREARYFKGVACCRMLMVVIVATAVGCLSRGLG